MTNTNNGLINTKSAHDVKTTADRLENTIKDKGMNVIARVNHTAAAQKIDETLRPTELIIFGNPKTGTPLMQSNQSVGIDLPQKALVWEDENADVWITHNDPYYLAERHNMDDCGGMIKMINTALNKIMAEAAN